MKPEELDREVENIFTKNRDKCFATIDCLIINDESEYTKADIEQLILDIEDFLKPKIQKLLQAQQERIKELETKLGEQRK